MATNELELVITSNADQMAKGFDKIANSIEQIAVVNQELNKSITSLIRPTQEWGKGVDQTSEKSKKLDANLKEIYKSVSNIALGLSTALVAGATKAVQSFIGFDEQMRKVLTNLDQASFGAKGLEKGFKDLTKQVLEIGKKTPQSLDQITAGLFDIVSAGIDANKAVVALNAGLKLAVAGGADSKVAIDALTSTINAYGLSLEQIDKVSAQFFEAQKFGKLDIQELAGAIADVAPIAANVGLGIDEMLSSISAITLTGANASEASTQLRSILVALLKPTEEQKKEAKALGIEFGLSTLKAKGLTGILTDLKNNTNLSADSFGKLFGRQEAISGILALTGSQFKQYSGILQSLNNDTKTAENFTKAYEVQNASLANQLKTLTNNITVLAIEMGSRLAPSVEKINRVLGNLIEYSQDASKETSGVTLAIAELSAGALIAVGSLRTLGLLVGFSLTGGMIGYAAAIGAATVAIYELATISDDTKKSITEFLKPLSTPIKPGLDLEAYNKELEQTRQLMFEAARATESFNDKLGRGSPLPFPIDIEKQKADFEEGKSLLTKTIEEAKKANGEIETSYSLMIDSMGEKENELTQKKAELTEAEKERLQLLADFRLQLQNENLMLLAEQEIIANDLRFQQGLIDEENHQMQLQEIRQRYALQKITAARSEAKTLSQIQTEISRDKIQQQNAENKKIEEDTQKSSAVRARNAAFFRKQEVQQTGELLDTLSTLTASNNKELFMLGKAASYARAVLNIAEGVTKALAQGGFLGYAMATAVSLAGAVQLATISSMKMPGAAKGMLVEGGIKGQDSVPIMAQEGELVVPRKNFEEVISSVKASRLAEEKMTGGEFGDNQVSNEVTINLGLKGNLFDMIEAEVIERRALNISKI